MILIEIRPPALQLLDPCDPEILIVINTVFGGKKRIVSGDIIDDAMRAKLKIMPMQIVLLIIPNKRDLCLDLTDVIIKWTTPHLHFIEYIILAFFYFDRQRLARRHQENHSIDSTSQPRFGIFELRLVSGVG